VPASRGTAAAATNARREPTAAAVPQTAVGSPAPLQRRARERRLVSSSGGVRRRDALLTERLHTRVENGALPMPLAWPCDDGAHERSTRKVFRRVSWPRAENERRGREALPVARQSGRSVPTIPRRDRFGVEGRRSTVYSLAIPSCRKTLRLIIVFPAASCPLKRPFFEPMPFGKGAVGECLGPRAPGSPLPRMCREYCWV
jgi:hypothetical protein